MTDSFDQVQSAGEADWRTLAKFGVERNQVGPTIQLYAFFSFYFQYVMDLSSSSLLLLFLFMPKSHQWCAYLWCFIDRNSIWTMPLAPSRRVLKWRRSSSCTLAWALQWCMKSTLRTNTWDLLISELPLRPKPTRRTGPLLPRKDLWVLRMRPILSYDSNPTILDIHRDIWSLKQKTSRRLGLCLGALRRNALESSQVRVPVETE